MAASSVNDDERRVVGGMVMTLYRALVPNFRIESSYG